MEVEIGHCYRDAAAFGSSEWLRFAEVRLRTGTAEQTERIVRNLKGFLRFPQTWTALQSGQ
jgi:hypothetical protein